MSNVRPLSKDIIVKFGNGSRAQAAAMGEVELMLITPNGCLQPSTLHNVLLVPECHINAVSVERATSKGVEFIFKGDTCTLVKQGVAFGQAHTMGGVFVLQTAEHKTSAVMASTRKVVESPELWHIRPPGLRQFDTLGARGHGGRYQRASILFQDSQGSHL